MLRTGKKREVKKEISRFIKTLKTGGSKAGLIWYEECKNTLHGFTKQCRGQIPMDW